MNLIESISEYIMPVKEKRHYINFENYLRSKKRCRWMKLKGSLGRRNEPDFLVIICNRAVLIEFKRLGETIEEAQEKRINWWTKAARATWCDTVEDAILVVDEEERLALMLEALEENISQ